MALLSRRGALALLGALTVVPALADEQPRTIKFGLTAVVVREELAFFERWAAYLQRRVKHPIVFVQRRSYHEIMDLLETGEVDFAWICGYPYVRERGRGTIDLLAVPVFDGQMRYKSYVIVHKDSHIKTIADLKGHVFAYSDPDSNSGYLAPRSRLAARAATPDTFFRLTFFTYSHVGTIEAVARQMADGGAVDSYVWEYLKRSNSPLTEQTRIIEEIGPFGFPPLVARSQGDRDVAERMRATLLDMHDDPEGQDLLSALKLERFSRGGPALFDGIAEMAEDLASRGRP
jgi:phosphonate transport system substrate-binding protein